MLFFFLLKKYLPGSWWALPLWTWTHSPWGKSKIGAPSTWRKSVSSWRSWKRSDRPSSGSERRVRIEGALSATTTRKTDLGLVAFLGWVAEWHGDKEIISAERRCSAVMNGALFPHLIVGVGLCIRAGTINFIRFKQQPHQKNLMSQARKGLSVLSLFLPFLF